MSWIKKIRSLESQANRVLRAFRSSKFNSIANILLTLILIVLLVIGLGGSQTYSLDSTGEIQYVDNPSLGNLPPIDDPQFDDGGINESLFNNFTNFDPNIFEGINFTNPGGENATFPEFSTPSSFSVPEFSQTERSERTLPHRNRTSTEFGNFSNPFNFSFPKLNFQRPYSKYDFFEDMKVIDLTTINVGGVRIKLTVDIIGLLILVTVILSTTFYLIGLPTITETLLSELQGTTESKKKYKKEKERRRKERERAEQLRKYKQFKTHLHSIIKKYEKEMDQLSAQKAIVTIYNSLDEAFSFFSGLRREPGITPLEHSKKSFLEEEINNKNLEEIVGMFYEVNYGNKLLNKDAKSKLLILLEGLINV